MSFLFDPAALAAAVKQVVTLTQPLGPLSDPAALAAAVKQVVTLTQPPRPLSDPAALAAAVKQVVTLTQPLGPLSDPAALVAAVKQVVRLARTGTSTKILRCAQNDATRQERLGLSRMSLAMVSGGRSEEFLELLWRKAGIPGDCAHCVGVDRVVAGDC